MLNNKSRCDEIFMSIQQTLESTTRINTGRGHAFHGQSFAQAPKEHEGLLGGPGEEKGSEKDHPEALKHDSKDLLEPQIMGVVVSIPQAPKSCPRNEKLQPSPCQEGC